MPIGTSATKKRGAIIKGNSLTCDRHGRDERDGVEQIMRGIFQKKLLQEFPAYNWA